MHLQLFRNSFVTYVQFVCVKFPLFCLSGQEELVLNPPEFCLILYFRYFWGSGTFQDLISHLKYSTDMTSEYFSWIWSVYCVIYFIQQHFYSLSLFALAGSIKRNENSSNTSHTFLPNQKLSLFSSLFGRRISTNLNS